MSNRTPTPSRGELNRRLRRSPRLSKSINAREIANKFKGMSNLREYYTFARQAITDSYINPPLVALETKRIEEQIVNRKVRSTLEIRMYRLEKKLKKLLKKK